MLTELGTLATHMSLHTADPGTAGASEVSGGSYARRATSWLAAGANSMSHGRVDFTAPAGTFTHVGFWSASSGGTFYGSARLAVAKVLSSAGAVTIDQVTVSLTEGQVIALTGAPDELRLLLHNATPKVLQAPVRVDPLTRVHWQPGGTGCAYDAEQGGWPVNSPDPNYSPLAMARGLAKAGPWFTDSEMWVDQAAGLADVFCTVPTLTTSNEWTIEAAFAAGGYTSHTLNQRIFTLGAALARINTGGDVEFFDGSATDTAASTIATLLSVSDWSTIEARYIAAGTSLDVDVRTPGGSWVSAVTGATIAAVSASGATLRLGGNVTAQGIRARYQSLRIRDGGADAPTVALFTPDLFAAGNRANGATAVDPFGVTWTCTRPDWAASTDIGRRIDPQPHARLVLPGLAGEYVSTPDSAAFLVDDDLELIAEVYTDDITPASDMTLVAQWESGQQSFRWTWFSSGDSTLNIDVGGGSLVSYSNTKIPAPVNDSIHLRVTRAHSTGNIAHFYRHAADDSWTQLGATDVLASGNLNNASGPLTVGASWTNGSDRPFNGSIRSAEVKIGGNTVARFNAADANPDASTWTDPVTGQINTINRSASIQQHVAVVPPNVEGWISDGVNDALTVIGDDSVGWYTPATGLTLALDARLHSGSNSYGLFMTNRDPTTDDGIAIQRTLTFPRVYGRLDDGTTVSSVGDGVDNISYGARFLAAFATTTSDRETYVNGLSKASSTATVGAVSPPYPMTLGCEPGGTQPLAAEFYGAAVVGKRATDSDVVTIAGDGLDA